MALAFGRTAAQDLTHIGLTLAPRRRRGRWLVRAALALCALAAGFALGGFVRDRWPDLFPERVQASAPAGPPPELVQLRRDLEEARMGLRVSEARGHELERQVDTLNQKLTESQDELTFFRKAREGRKH